MAGTAPLKKKKRRELVDPRQIVFTTGYQDPKSPTYSNAYASAKAAGYSDSYARRITAQMPAAVSDLLRNEKLIKRAEAHLEESLDMPIITQAMGAFGPLWQDEKKTIPVLTYNTSRIKEKTKVADIVLSALKKDVYGKDTGTKIGFQFNVSPPRERYVHD